jgi:PmbA protein
VNKTLQEIVQQVVDRAKSKGATAADAFLREDETFSVTVRRGDVEKLKEAVSRSLGVRVFLGTRTATSQTSDLSLDRVGKLVDETIEMARLTSEDDSGGLPEESLYPRAVADLRLADPSWEDLTPDQRIELARRAEAAAFETDPLITNSGGSSFEYERSRTVLANTLGFAGDYEATAASIVTGAIAEANGTMQRSHWYSVARHRDQLDSPEHVGRIAAQRALQCLGARKVETCQVPIVFDPMTARTLVKHIFDAVSGDAIYKKRSFLVGKLGESVASANVTIVDDARLAGGLGSSPFDDEGIATQTTSIVENGVLQNYLHSAYSARKLQTRPTGNGSRTGTGSISVGPTNFYLRPGTHSAEQIIGSVASGLYVLDLIGFGVNTVNGDYSRGVSGLWIEDGKLAYPVQEVTIAGNLRQMLQDIEMIGSDISFMGAVSAPTVKIRSMTLSGE